MPKLSLPLLLVSILSGCTRGPTAVLESLRISGVNQVLVERPTQFRSEISITNQSEEAIRFYVNCGRQLRVLTLADSLGAPIWSSSPPGLECSGALSRSLTAGESFSYEYRVAATDILGGTHPDDVYRIEAIVPINGRRVAIHLGRLMLAR